MRKEDAGIEGPFEGTISRDGPESSGAFQVGGAFSEGQFGTADFGAELPPTIGGDSRGTDSGDGSPAPTGKRRGRPPGSGTKSPRKSGAIPESRLAAIRAKLSDGAARLVGFGFSAYGVVRGNKYKKFSPELAQRVYACYQLPMPAAQSVGEPIADTFIEWFPQWIEPAAKGIDPALAIGRLISVLQQTSDNEKAVVTQFYERLKQPEPSTNGHTPPAAETPPESPVEEWMSQQGIQPEEVLTTNIPTS